MNAPSPNFASVDTLDALYAASGELDLTPGWVPRDTPVLWKEPKSRFHPAHWSFAAARTALDAAGRLIDVSLAERRNLIMRNPAPGTNFETTRTMVCAYQMILPGEVAPSHRHAPHALRVIIDSAGSYSIVNGTKMPMESGDVVLTPGWHWHAHGHDGDDPGYWFDGLDVPLTHLLEPMFYEEHEAGVEDVVTVTADSPFRFSRDNIDASLSKVSADPEGVFGKRINLATPDMPTVTLHIDRLETGTRTRRYRSTANTIFFAMEGSGESKIGDRTVRWAKGDTFVAPTWTDIQHTALADSQLFTMSDEGLQRFSKFYRFEAY